MVSATQGAGMVESSGRVPVSAETQLFSGLPKVYRLGNHISNTPVMQISVKLIRSIDTNPAPIYWCKDLPKPDTPSSDIP